VSRLIQRVAALEAAQPAHAPNAQQSASLSAAVGALLDASESGADPAHRHQCGREFLLALQQRLDTGTTTEADRAMLAELPTCHLPPPALVWALCELMADRPGRSISSARA